MERLVENGYVKMIAIDVSDLESKIIDEKTLTFYATLRIFKKSIHLYIQ